MVEIGRWKGGHDTDQEVVVSFLLARLLAASLCAALCCTVG